MTKTFKHSGVEWLGEIPQHWEVLPLRAIFRARNEDNKDLKFTQILSLIKDVGVIPYEEKGDVGNKSKDDLSGYKIARKNDFVLNKMNAVIGSLGVSNYDGLVSPVYLVLYIANSKALLNFYDYVFQSKLLQKSLKQVAYGLMEIRESIDFLEFKKFKFPLPPLDEQRKIAGFLDEKCGKIAEFIAKKQALIALLKERKKSLINEAVCGRLNLNSAAPREFKRSGVEWLGEIPQHWEVRKLKQIGKFGKGNNITKSYISSEGQPFIVYGDIYTKYNIKAENIFNKISNSNSNLATLVRKNTLLFSASGELIEDIGKCVVLLADFAYIGGDVITFNPKNCDSIFLSYALNSSFAIYQKAIMGKGDIIVHIHISNLANLQIPLPPLNEQQKIAEFLDEKCAEIDKACAMIQAQIEAMREYKSSLIDSAVRGKFEFERTNDEV